MNYLLMSTAFSTDKVNRMGFSKYFKEQSDKMGGNFQIPPLGAEKQIGDFDYSNEMKAMGTTLDMLKGRAQDTITAYRHSLSKGLEVFDPATAHKLEELSEDYTEEIHEVAKKLNTLGKLVRESSSNAMGLHLYDRSLM